VQAAARIAAGSDEILQLGNLAIYRDWGWAPEYVQAMWLMLQQDAPSDYVIATGRTVSLSYFVEKTFAHFDLDWHAHVEADNSLLRPSDIAYGAGDPTLAARVLGWTAQNSVDEVINAMCRSAAP
jgi:GDPmannose 4,6-dehydratase